MENTSRLTLRQREEFETLFDRYGYNEFSWIEPQNIVTAQWVRMKCIYGCSNYARKAACPPNVPSVSECERFFREYSDAVVFHFEKKVPRPEDRHVWSRKVNLKLLKLEREVFLSGYERAFLLFMDSCELCAECAGQREACKGPRKSRPSPEALSVDVYTTVRRLGFTIEVRTDYLQKMDRYAFLMIQ